MVSKPDVICLSETWVDASYSGLYHLDDYTLVLIPRKKGKGGGVGAYISTRLSFACNWDFMTNHVTSST